MDGHQTPNISHFMKSQSHKPDNVVFYSYYTTAICQELHFFKFLLKTNHHFNLFTLTFNLNLQFFSLLCYSFPCPVNKTPTVMSENLLTKH